MPYWLSKLDQGHGRIDWATIRKEVSKPGALWATSAKLTASGHVALGVAMHTGRDKTRTPDGTGHAREFEMNVDSFIKKPAYE